MDDWERHLLQMQIESAEECGDGAGAEELRDILYEDEDELREIRADRARGDQYV